MFAYKPRVWAMLGVSAVALAGVGACQPPGDGTSTNTAAASATQAPPKAGELATNVAPAMGEAGEAGAQNAYADIPEGSRLGLRIAHVTGFLLIAQKTYASGQANEASVLVSQGLLEVYTPAAAQLDAGASGLKSAFEKVVASIDANKPKAEVDAAFDEAIKIAREREIASGAAPQDVVKGMLSIGAGLYALVIMPEGNDPIEYQHAQGAILAAQSSFEASKSKLAAYDKARTETAAQDIQNVVALFPAVALPDNPASVAAVTGAVSRTQLALSGIG